MIKPSAGSLWFDDTEPKAKLTYLQTSIGVAFLVSLIPTGTYRNLGYVDPNMYVGYGNNLSWLVENVGFEYHATRLPLIFLIKFLLLFPAEMFGFLFKFVCLFIVSISWFFLCRNLRISFDKSLLGSFLILMSPLSISASSWTFPNTFSAITCCLILPLITKKELKRKDLFSVGLLVANVAVLNILFAFLICVIITVFLFEKSLIVCREVIFWTFLGVIMMWIVFESIWSLILGFPRSIWLAQYKGVTSIDRWGNEYWQPISFLLNDRNMMLNFLSFILVGIVVSSFLIFGARESILEPKYRRTPISVLVLSVTVLILYFAKSFIGFSELWYYYVAFLIHFLVLASFLTSRLKTLNTFIPVLMFFSTVVFYLKWQVDFNPTFAAISLVLASILIFIGCHLFVKYIKIKSNRPSSSILALSAIYFIGSSLLFLNPSFGNAYLPNDNGRNAKFIRAQTEVMEYVGDLNSSKESIALWTGPDTSNILGGLESTLGYHLIRLDGVAPRSSSISVTNWERIHGEKPERILVLLRSGDFERENQTVEGILDVAGYCIAETKDLPSANAIILLLKFTQENFVRKC